jgi:ABC-type transport system involved in cytochrome c biogenesis ATPase subunit
MESSSRYFVPAGYLNWEPYALELPFQRDFEEDIQQTLKAVLKDKSPLPKAVWITGESGIGKTTTLRNCAYRLAQQGHVCFWVKPQYSRSSTKEWL